MTRVAIYETDYEHIEAAVEQDLVARLRDPRALLVSREAAAALEQPRPLEAGLDPGREAPAVVIRGDVGADDQRLGTAPAIGGGTLRDSSTLNGTGGSVSMIVAS